MREIPKIKELWKKMIDLYEENIDILNEIKKIIKVDP